MKKLDDKTKTGLVYLLSGTLLMLLAAKPPHILTKIYLALERAAALVLGFAMALAGAAVVFHDRTADTIIAAEAQATEANEPGHEGEL